MAPLLVDEINQRTKISQIYPHITSNRRSLALCSRYVHSWLMAEIDPETPEWTIAWAIKRLMRLHLGPRHGYLPGLFAKEVVAALTLSKWRLVKDPPDQPHSSPGPSRAPAIECGEADEQRAKRTRD